MKTPSIVRDRGQIRAVEPKLRRGSLGRAVEKLVYPPLPKYFNTAGPCLPGRHYMLPPLPRVPEAEGLVEQGGYFVLHAPRQSGKTTFLIALAEALTAGGRYAALYTSCEVGEAAGDDSAVAQRVIVQRMLERAEDQLPVALRPPPLVVPEDETRLTSFLVLKLGARAPWWVALEGDRMGG